MASLICAHAASAGFTAGAAKVDITPDYPIRLNGYLARKAESTGVAQHIFAKALAFGADGGDVAVLISVDNCILPAHVREELVRRLKGKGVRPERLAINTSHTHAAPKLAGAADNIFGHDIAPEEQAHIDRYTREFIDYLEKAAVTALENRRPATLAWGQTKATFAANRRVKNGPVDHDLPVLVVKNDRGEIQALVTSYACHCTTLGPEPNEISGDWAGYAQEYLEAAHPGVIALTLVGCGAEANPEPRGTVELAQKHGHSIADAVDARLAKPLAPLSAPLACRTETIAIPFDTLPTREEWQAKAAKNDPTGYHARKNLARLDRGEKLPRELPYEVQVWNFGPELAMVFLNGEVVQDYSLRLKREFDATRLWVNGYSNVVPCYIPSRRVWQQGGYEGALAMIYYDLPTRLVENTEELIIASVTRLMPAGYAAASATKR